MLLLYFKPYRCLLSEDNLVQIFKKKFSPCAKGTNIILGVY